MQIKSLSSCVQGKHTSTTQICISPSLGKKLWNNKNSVSKYTRILTTNNLLELMYEPAIINCLGGFGFRFLSAELCHIISVGTINVPYTVQETSRERSI